MRQVILGLARGLAALPDGDERYSFLVHEEHAHELEPWLGRGGELLLAGRAPQPPAWRAWLTERAPRLRVAARWVRNLRATARVQVPASDGRIERADVDLMHFLTPSAFLTRVPSIYHPHDLQHRHLPEFFQRRDRVRRDVLYAAFCEQARCVPVTSQWVLEDVVSELSVPREKLRVIPWAPLAGAEPSEDELAAVRQRFRLPEAFALYPAQTYPHKNHARLFEALALLRANGVRVDLICTGHRSRHHDELRERLAALDLAAQVRFLGYVSEAELSALYRACRLVCVPTLFEAASFPVWEAFAAGAPVVCSNVTSLPAQVGDAAVLFDPRDVEQIARGVLELWTDEGRRRELVARGEARVRELSWPRTALRFRELYRELTGRDKVGA